MIDLPKCGAQALDYRKATSELYLVSKYILRAKCLTVVKCLKEKAQV